MTGINYLMSRVTIFVVLCVIWLSMNGRLVVRAQSSPHETPPTPATTENTQHREPSVTSAPEKAKPPETDNNRAVNLMMIYEKNNQIAKKSVANALNVLHQREWGSIGNGLTIDITGEDPKEELKRICDIWDNAVKGDPSDVPDFVLDTTRSGYAAETVSAFTAAVGIPTLSAQFGREGDIKNWRNLSDDQYKYLIQVMPPADVIFEALRQFVHRMNIANAGVIFDQDYVMDRRYYDLFDNTTTRFVAVPMKETDDEVARLIEQFRRLDIFNYFILGNSLTVRTVLDVGKAMNLDGREYGWYVASQYDANPRCDCKDHFIVFIKPLISKITQQRLTSLGQLLSEPLLSSAFYFDLTQIGVMAMKRSIVKRKWPTDSPHLTCEDFDGQNTPTRNFDFYKELVRVSSASRFQPSSAGFSWGGRNGRNHATFNMTARMLTLAYAETAKDEELGFWSAGLHSEFQIKNEEVMRKHGGSTKYRITTVIKEPFVMYDAKSEVWSGYCIDLINKLASMMNFTYSISEVADRQYGRMGENGRWNGMMRELQKKRADIALGALSVMAERKSVADFTVPYYDLVGFSILMRKPKRATNLFKFLTVLANDVWLAILGSYFCTSIFLTIFNRWSPYSYRNNLEQFKDDNEKREFTLRESLWFSMTSLTPQGGGIAPKNLSGRLVAATWWLFGFIIIASYTANLSAFLTVSRLETMVESLDDLSKQYRIQYAPIIQSDAFVYFKRMADIEEHFYETWRDMSLSKTITELERSKLAVWEYPASYEYTKLFQNMAESKFPRNISEALDRIRRVNNRTNDFALIGDASDIKYLTITNCDLIEVGTEFSRRPYALAVQRGSPLRERFNDAILQLGKERELVKLKDRWWDKNPKKLECEAEELQSDGISMANIGGIFLVTFAGIGVAILTLSIEYYWYRVLSTPTKNMVRDASADAKTKNPSVTEASPKPAKTAFQSDETKSRF